jgi:uroporphyrinogen decarboxylase
VTLTALSKLERYRLAVAGEEVDHPPAWIMRQAGRYMPEYQALRRQYSFAELCHNPEAAAQASYLPLTILDVDVLIIFNDILTPLEEMGIKVEFPDGGPQILNPARTEEDVARLRPASFHKPPVAHSIRRLRELAGHDVPIIGFCGSPFTLACYAVEGRMSKTQEHIKRLRFESANVLHALLDRLTETAANYLIAQIDDGGADAVQIFESWGGTLAAPHDYEEFAALYQRRLINKVRAACPDTPIHLYVKGCTPFLDSMARSGANVLGIDWNTPLSMARERTTLALQGNLDPMAMLVPDCIEDQVAHMVEGFDWRRGWIANLGHGITPQGTVEAARRFVQAIHALPRRQA